MKISIRPKVELVPDTLIVSDLHFVDSVRDNYRWNLFPWIIETIKEHKIQFLFILGDILDKKDRHPSELSNKVVDNLEKIQQETSSLLGIYILKGNHDYIKADIPFFKFMDKLPDIAFIINPEEIHINGINTLWLPHTKTPEEAWKNFNFNEYDLIFMHQSVIGARVSNYYEMKEGLSPDFFTGCTTPILSGDIHVPQTLKVGDTTLTYIGTPYPIAFGDVYKPRGLLLDLKSKRHKDIHFTNYPEKLSLKVNSPDEIIPDIINTGDQIKVTLKLTQAELADWTRYKNIIKQKITDLGAELVSIKLEKIQEKTSSTKEKTPSTYTPITNPTDILTRYAANEKLDENLLKIGLDIISNKG